MLCAATEASLQRAARHNCVCMQGSLSLPCNSSCSWELVNSRYWVRCVRRSIFPVDIWASPDRSSSVSDWSQSLLKGFFFNLRRPKTSSRWPLLDLAASCLWGCCLQVSKGTEVTLPWWLWGARVLSLPLHLQGFCRWAQNFWIFLGWGKFY